jgi:hypothetical protein
MEIIIPGIALASLYIAINQKKENFSNYLPNTDIPNKNYPSEYPIQSTALDQTSRLSHDNRYDGTAYTDKYFNPNSGQSLLATTTNTVKNVNGKTDNKEAFVAAVKAASIELKSVRGPFKFGSNNMPVQNYYAFQTVKEGSVITVKQLSTPLAQHPDVYATLCKAK